jgi:hypothetical protein
MNHLTKAIFGVAALSCSIVACVTVAGCSASSPPELAPGEATGGTKSLEIDVTAASTAAAPGVSPALAGYQHAASASHFALGAAPVVRAEQGMSKVVGTFGVFATVTATGMTLGISNANSPARGRPPLSTDGATHNAAVRSYFTQSGLAVSQIAAVTEQAAMQGGGAEGSTNQPPTFDYYYSTISRQTPSGVAIQDSYAWARINADGEVVMESVFWPEIPASVIAEAEGLRTALGNATSRASFLAKIPQDPGGESARGRVVIRHTSGAWPHSFSAHASYDVHHGNRVVHYTSTGAPLELSEEAKNAWGPIQATVK